jgi:hypothetical protein
MMPIQEMHPGIDSPNSLMDYALPRASDLPKVDASFLQTRAADNPLGVKGARRDRVNGGFRKRYWTPPQLR